MGECKFNIAWRCVFIKLKEIIKEVSASVIFNYKGNLKDEDFKISNSAYGIGVDFKDKNNNWYKLIQNNKKKTVDFKTGHLYEGGKLIYRFNFIN